MNRRIAIAAATVALVGHAKLAVSGHRPDEATAGLGDRSCPACSDTSEEPPDGWLSDELGFDVLRFRSLLGEALGNAGDGNAAFARRTVMQQTLKQPFETAGLLTVRFMLRLPRPLYAAVSLEAGAVSSSGHEPVATDPYGTPMRLQEGAIIEPLGAVGLRSESRSIAFGVELAGGARLVEYRFIDPHNAAQLPSFAAGGAVAELRARGEIWLSPWVTVGATAGASLIERGSWMTGVYFALHPHAFNTPRCGVTGRAGMRLRNC